MFGAKKIIGECDLITDQKSYPDCRCVIDIDEQVLKVNLPNPQPFSPTHAFDAKAVQIPKASFWTPYGRLSTSIEKNLFIQGQTQQSWSADSTYCAELLAIKEHLSEIKIILNDPILFKLDTDHFEKLYVPGFEVLPAIQLSGETKIVGGENSISVLGKQKSPEPLIRLALGVAAGAPMSLVANCGGNELYFYLNNAKLTQTKRPLFVRSTNGWKDLEKQNEGFKETFESTLAYLEKCDDHTQKKAIFAMTSYLQARSQVDGYELKLMGAYHFLEWIDGGKTLNRNQLVDVLQASNEEAQGIIDVRNGLIHNRLHINEVIQRGYDKISGSRSELYEATRSQNFYAGFMNYLFSLLDRKLLEIVGSEAQPEFYLPPKQVQ